MLRKVFNWLHDTTLPGDRIALSATRHYWVGSTGNKITGLANNSRPQYESMKAIMYLGIR